MSRVCFSNYTQSNAERLLPRRMKLEGYLYQTEHVGSGTLPIGSSSALAVFMCKRIDISSQTPTSKVLAAFAFVYSSMSDRE